MKKDKYIAIFMTTLMIAIPIGAVLILIVYAFSFMAIPEDKTTYDFIKDHGSLVAGVLGVIGVVILVLNQNKTTRKTLEKQDKTTQATIDVTLKAILLESRAIEKRMHKLDLVEVANYSDSMIRDMVSKKGKLEYRDYKGDLHRVIEITKRLVFLIVDNDNVDRYYGLLFIKSFFIFYDELFKLIGKEFPDSWNTETIIVNDERENALHHLQMWYKYSKDNDNKLILQNIKSLSVAIKAVPKERSRAYVIDNDRFIEINTLFRIMDSLLKDIVKTLDS